MAMTLRCRHCLVPLLAVPGNRTFCDDECLSAFRAETLRALPKSGSLAIRTYAEVAEELGISKSRVEQIERVALKKLRKVMNMGDFL